MCPKVLLGVHILGFYKVPLGVQSELWEGGPCDVTLSSLQ